MPSFCRSATRSAPTDHEGGVEHVDGGDDAGAVVGAGPGLHRGEGRHDEQPAGDGEAGEIDGEVNAARRGRNTRRCPIGCAACTIADAVQPRSSAKTGRAARRRTASAAARCARRASQAARPEPTATATEKMARKSVTTPSVPPIRLFTSGGSSDSTMAPTSQNQLTTIAPHHSRGSARTYLTQADRSRRRCSD